MADSKKKTDTMEDLRKLDKQQLTTKIADLRKELVEQQRANRAGELPNSTVITKIRKNIAKCLTVINEAPQDAKPAQEEQEK